MWGQAKGSFWAKDDNKVMLRHVLAMAGVSSTLAVCLHASALQPELAYAEENTPSSALAQIDTVFRAADDVAASSSSLCVPVGVSDSSKSLSDIAVDTASAEVGGHDVKEPSSGSGLTGGLVANSSALAIKADDSDSTGAAVSASGSEVRPQLKDNNGEPPSSVPIPEKVEDGAYSIISALGKTLEVDGASVDNHGNIQTWNDNKSAAQRFHIKAEGQVESGEWYYSIANVNSGKVLDCVAGGTTSGTNVQQYTSNGTGAQQWFLRLVSSASGDSYYQIVNVKSGLVLDVLGASSRVGANVQIYSSNGTAAQQWVLKKWNREIADGAYTIASALDSEYVIDISGASGDDCAVAQIFKSNGTLAQMFAINYDEYSGYYKLTNYASGKALDVIGCSADAGALIQQYGLNGTRAQLWNIVKNTDGSVSFISAINGHALDVMWAAAQNCTRLQQWDWNQSAAQRFFLREAVPIFDGGLVEIRNGANGYMVMDIPGASKDAGVGVQLYEQNRTFAQKYMVELNDDGSYGIRNVASGLYLSVDQHGSVSQQGKGSSFVQQWAITATKTGHFALSPVGCGDFLGSAKASSGAGLSLFEDCRSMATWNFVKAALLESGLYTIASAVDSRSVLDISGANLSYYGNVQVWESNGTNAQKFMIQCIGDNLYSITNAWSALALDVDGGSARPGTNVQQYGWNDTNAQKWIAMWDGHGGIVFKSAVGDYALSTSGNYSGSNVHLEQFDINNASQRFALTPTSLSFASFSDRINVLDSIDGWGLNVFKSLKGVSGQTWNDLWGAIENYTNSGTTVAFLMMDLATGAGVSYNADKYFESASTIKGPYIAALNMYMPWALDSWAGTMHETILNSTNETYAALRQAFGAEPMYRLANETHAWDFNWDSWYTYYSPRMLAKLWTGMADYFMSERQNAWWCRNEYSSNNWITSRPELSWKGCTIYAKSGWLHGDPTVHNEGCLVMDGDHPYLMVVMSTAEVSNNGWKMAHLMSVLDRAHSEII